HLALPGTQPDRPGAGRPARLVRPPRSCGQARVTLAGPKTAMVLAAGLGTRMRPLTDAMPKALIPVAGRALLDRVLDELRAAGVERAVINVHHFADQVEAHLARRSDLEILISDERGGLLDSGGGIQHARVL